MKRTFSQLHPHPRSSPTDARRPHSGHTRKRPQMDAGWTHGECTRGHSGRTVDAQWTQDTRVLDTVFDKLFLGNTV